MEFAPSSRPSSPTHTNSSSATRVEPNFLDFYIKKANNLPRLMTSDRSDSDHSSSPKIPLSPADEVPKSQAARDSPFHSPSRRPSRRRMCGLTSPSRRGKPSHTPAIRDNLLRSPSPRERHSSRNSSVPPRSFSPPASPPYGKPKFASPLELRMSARALGQECHPEFRDEDIVKVCSHIILFSSF